MALTWTPWSITGYLAFVLSWALAVIVYRTRPDRSQNRILAVVLLLAGGEWLMMAGIMQSTTSRPWAYGAQLVFMALHPWVHYTHLLFLSTLPTRVMAWLRPTPVRFGLGAVFGAWSLWIIAMPGAWLTNVIAPPHPVTLWIADWGPAFTLWWVFDGLWWLGLIAAISAYRNRSAWQDRGQAKAYLAGFAVHDGLFAMMLASYMLGVAVPPLLESWLATFPWPMINIWLVLALSYGALRTQLFDIDLKVKWTIKRGTVASVFVAVFFVVGVTVENWLTSTYGWAIGGIVAGIMLFAIQPLMRFGERVADAAMPRVRDTPRYRAERSATVYRTAYAGMLMDGQLTEKEKDVLARLAVSLALNTVQVRAIETSFA